MSKINHTLLLVFMMLAPVLATSGCASPLTAKAEGLAGMGALPRETQLQNLLSDLELRASQMRFIMEKAQEAEEVRDKYATRERCRAEMTRIAREVKVVLEQHQIYTLVHHSSSAIPTQDEAQIDQTDVATVTEAVLVSIRTTSDAEFEWAKGETARDLMELLEGHLPGGFILIINEEEEVTRIASILGEARSLSAVEFELQRADLVQEVLFAYGLHEKPVDACLQIEQYLLDPLIIPLLQRQLAPMAGYVG
jgi:hypothetical protein